MIIAIIIGCEIGFWVFIALGLTARYLLRRRKLGAVLLAMTPLVDLILLVAAGWDLAHGGIATFAHSLAAIYLGFSIAYGHRMIAWADLHFAHRFAHGPAPVKLTGVAYTQACWADVIRTLFAVGISAGVLTLLIWIAADDSSTGALTGTFRVLGTILVLELIWAVSYTLWPKKDPADAKVPEPKM
ncbi:hypothetical protein G7067_03740 [Leucobacter insecticola]|uniref:Uncharacterized protein n=1 Tax=Leucobacter insecticola TaxID=2714934 RepID=A0A6G8FH97_9MICO|nr:hypothetical protein [Leucobacter insecticola]QIM15727.1 hypothetical protein G7067_03740 [Leucobacter insecticola]